MSAKDLERVDAEARVARLRRARPALLALALLMLAAMVWRGLYRHDWRLVSVLGPLACIFGYLMWGAVATGRLSNTHSPGGYLRRESQPLAFWCLVAIFGVGYFFAVGYLLLA